MDALMRAIDKLVNHRTIATLLVVVGVLEVVFFLRLIWPASFGFIVENHLFEIVVLLVLVQIVLLLLKIIGRSDKRSYQGDHELEAAVRSVLRTDRRATSVHVFSSGLSSRVTLITTFNRDRPSIRTEVLVQDPEHAVDREDGDRLTSTIRILQRSPHPALEIRRFVTPSTIRAILICGDKRQPIWGAVSWYFYTLGAGTQPTIRGRDNPTFILSADSSMDDQAILNVFMDQFEKMWKESADAVACSRSTRDKVDDE